ncbi:MAG: nucleotidyltransferase substrate binding protein, partial [Bacteroidales bacterium]|nr:nucleotidyltransferase substrate binding protein [Bacteroidales bacterium]
MVAENKDIRWKQRFQNFEKAFLLLEKAVSIDNPSEVERAGLIQFFEITFELSWKLMADYLEELGFVANSP